MYLFSGSRLNLIVLSNKKCSVTNVEFSIVGDDNPLVNFNPKNNSATITPPPINTNKPTIKNESIVLIQQCESLEDLEIGAFFLNGEVFCKRLQHIDKITFLMSDNDSYSPIQINEDDDLKTFGKVIEVINNV